MTKPNDVKPSTNTRNPPVASSTGTSQAASVTAAAMPNFNVARPSLRVLTESYNPRPSGNVK